MDIEPISEADQSTEPAPTLIDEPSLDRSDHDQSHLVEGELLVEEISIDGMCGVY